MRSNDQNTTTDARTRLLVVYAGLALLIAANIAGSIAWITNNIVLVGRDAAGHLERTVLVNEALSSFSIRSLFTALTLTDYRPPLLYLATVPFYRLLGVSMDSAQMLNVALLGLVLLLTFVLARRMFGAGWALFAVIFTGLLPMMAAMARLFYAEHLLTALLLSHLLSLLNSRGFTHRRWALAWGVTLGLALLVKWTTPVYLLLATLYVLGCGLSCDRQANANYLKQILATIILPFQQTYRTRFRLPSSLKQWRGVVLAMTGALFIAAVLYWPNRDRMDEFFLGHWIPIFWMVLFAGALYVLRLPHGLATNFWSALLVAASIASVWYFPRIDFLSRLTDVAFGTDRGTQEALDLLRLNNYTRYFDYLRSHHLGVLGMWAILPAALWGGLQEGRSKGRAALDQGRIVLWLVIISTYVLLALIAQANPRNLNPLLPLIAILLTDSLRSYVRSVALAIGAIWLVVLGLQWSIYTFDGMAWLYQRTPQLWVSGDYLPWPATGPSDPGYWIQPDVLEIIGNPQGEAASFGMLIDAWELHRGSFRFLIAAGHLNIELMALTESASRGWSDLLANQWVLLKDGDNGMVHEAGRQVITRILSGDPLFRLIYDDVKRYKLPNGETAILYHRTEGPAHPYKYPVVLIETAAIAEAINRYWSKGATLYFSNIDTATWVGIHDLKADQIVIPQVAGETAASLLAETTGSIFAVTRYDTPEVQNWLFANGYPAVEVGEGEFHLTIIGRPSRSLTPLPVNTRWKPVEFPVIHSLPALQVGEVLPVDLTAAGQVDGTLKISLRLIDPAGGVIAQQDKIIEPQFRLGLFIPPDVQPGRYRLAGVVYDPVTMQPILDMNGLELGELAIVEVRGGSEAAGSFVH